MSKVKLSFLVLGVVVVVAGLYAYNLLFSDTSLEATGPTRVSDYRDFPVTEGSVSLVADGLDAPWSFAWLPNGDVLVTERFGSLRMIRDGVLLEAPVIGVPDVFSAGQAGLLDVTVHPDFAENRWVYVSYADGTEEGNRLRVTRAALNGGTLEDAEVIFEVAQTKTGSGHYGSRFQWLPDGTLLFSVGDGGNPPIQYNGELIREQAQYLSAHLGKFIRINDDGTIPQDNPFAGRPDVRQEIFSYGHRNPQGVTYDIDRNRIIASEHGSKGGDELNVVAAGANYGWPLATYATEYDMTGTAISPDQSLPGMQDPMAVWTPSIAPSGVVYYTGDRYGANRGDLFLAAMVLRENNAFAAYASSPAGGVIRMDLDEAGAVAGQQLITLGEVRVRSLEQGPDGFLYALTDATSPQNKAGENNGALWRIDGF